MAKVVKTNELPIISNLAGAKLIGLDANGVDAQFSLTDIKGDYKGEATPETIPVTPVLNQYYSFTQLGLYANFKDSNGTAINIPTPAGNSAVMNGRLVYTGTGWAASYNVVALPIQDLTNINNDISGIKGKTNTIEINDNGDFAIVDALKNIGLILTKLGILKISGLEAKSVKINGITVNLSDLIKTADFTPVSAALNTLTGALKVDAAGDFIIGDSNGYVGMKLSAAGILSIFKMIAKSVQVGNSVITDDPDYIIAQTDGNKNIGWAITKAGTLIVKGIQAQNLKISGTADIPGLSGPKYARSKWSGKTILWMGTSIPWGSGYPETAAAQNNATCINKAYPSSMARAGKKDGTYNGLKWSSFVYSMGHTNAQKQDIINNWPTYRDVLTGSTSSPVPSTLTTTLQADILAASYENKLLPYLNGTNPMPDLFIFDHGFNDWEVVGKLETDSDFLSIPANRVDKNYFIGAINSFIDLIYQYNPRARIAFSGHYDNKRYPQLAAAQQVLADYWGLPILKLWEKTGWTNQLVPGSSALWSVAPYSSYTSGVDTSKDMTMRQLWLPDGVHPYTDPQNRGGALMGDIVGSFLYNIF